MSGRAFTTHNKRQANDRLRTKESHLGRRRRGIDAADGEPKKSACQRFRRCTMIADSRHCGECDKFAAPKKGLLNAHYAITNPPQCR
ncbi:unnamed protein product [Strongylus vulgaris]|uniref:Uncharacterized protein n=1 Tax=Strongylus vulgaris TaxID=40348 RepID=A0A3P7L941_STRVU|nr:unnamed protein product [Strongylus vulgaris]